MDFKASVEPLVPFTFLGGGESAEKDGDGEREIESEISPGARSSSSPDSESASESDPGPSRELNCERSSSPDSSEPEMSMSFAEREACSPRRGFVVAVSDSDSDPLVSFRAFFAGASFLLVSFVALLVGASSIRSSFRMPAMIPGISFCTGVDLNSRARILASAVLFGPS